MGYPTVSGTHAINGATTKGVVTSAATSGAVIRAYTLNSITSNLCSIYVLLTAEMIISGVSLAGRNHADPCVKRLRKYRDAILLVLFLGVCFYEL